jgi:hypothetical protein
MKKLITAKLPSTERGASLGIAALGRFGIVPIMSIVNDCARLTGYLVAVSAFLIRCLPLSRVLAVAGAAMMGRRMRRREVDQDRVFFERAWWQGDAAVSGAPVRRGLGRRLPPRSSPRRNRPHRSPIPRVLVLLSQGSAASAKLLVFVDQAEHCFFHLPG